MLVDKTVLVKAKYIHKLADISNADSWFTEVLPFSDVDKLINEGFLVQVEWDGINTAEETQ